MDLAFSKESIGPWALILGSMGLLYYYDEEILKDTQRTGRKWGIRHDDQTKPVIRGFGQDLLRLPSDTGSFLYFLGDGWMHASILCTVCLFDFGGFSPLSKSLES